tara:strand:- start:7740 stop:8180 length:441 start_codon:yes stop_codon:yes gene_type:complete
MLMEVAESLGFKTKSIDYRQLETPEQRVDLLKSVVRDLKDEKIILVGSSMGGYVSTAVANELDIDGLFLMCPALYLQGYEIQSFKPKTSNIEIVHSWGDDIVPYENSIKFSELNLAKLHLISDNHRLSNTHDFLNQIFYMFICKFL